jgi:hypothetical protein
VADSCEHGNENSSLVTGENFFSNRATISFSRRSLVHRAAYYVKTYRVTRIKRNPCLGWDIFKIVSKKMRDTCFPNFGNTVKTGDMFLQCYQT